MICWLAIEAASLGEYVDVVLVLGGDHIYKMDCSIMLAEHAARGAAMTVACLEVPVEQASEFGVMSVDADHRIVAFAEKPVQPVALAHRPTTPWCPAVASSVVPTARRRPRPSRTRRGP